MSWKESVSKYHDYLKQAMEPYRGQEFEKKAITKILLEKFPELERTSSMIYPSDHSINHSNEGACRCALSEYAIFERLGWGKYRVL